MPFGPPFGDAPIVALGEIEGTRIGVVGAGVVTALAFDCGIGVGDAFGTSKRPRRCDGVGEVGGDETAVAAEVGATVAVWRGVIVCVGVAGVVEAGVDTAAAVAAGRGVIVCVGVAGVVELGVIMAAAVGATVALADVEIGEEVWAG